MGPREQQMNMMDPSIYASGKGGAPRHQKATAGRSNQKDLIPKKAFQPYHALRVPKEADLSNTGQQSTMDKSVTTLMLRNIPNNYKQTALLREIDKLGFAGTYDFFYLPMDVHNRSNVGYAFINFLDPASAAHCCSKLSNYKFKRYHSKKICAVSPAHLQGFEKNVAHFEHRAVMNAHDNQYRPVVLRGCAQSQALELDKALENKVPDFPSGQQLPDFGDCPPDHLDCSTAVRPVNCNTAVHLATSTAVMKGYVAVVTPAFLIGFMKTSEL